MTSITKKKAIEKTFERDEVKVDLLLAKLMEEADLYLDMEPFKIISACHVLEKIELVVSSFMVEHTDDSVTRKHFFMATEKLKEMMEEQGLIDD